MGYVEIKIVHDNVPIDNAKELKIEKTTYRGHEEYIKPKIEYQLLDVHIWIQCIKDNNFYETLTCINQNIILADILIIKDSKLIATHKNIWIKPHMSNKSFDMSWNDGEIVFDRLMGEKLDKETVKSIEGLKGVSMGYSVPKQKCELCDHVEHHTPLRKVYCVVEKFGNSEYTKGVFDSREKAESALEDFGNNYCTKYGKQFLNIREVEVK